jgi:four helix bundle protein
MTHPRNADCSVAHGSQRSERPRRGPPRCRRVNELIDHSPPRRLLHVAQMRKSAQSIGATIAEAFGREDGPDRRHRLVISRGETEETIEHLGSNYRSGRLTSRQYWPIHNLLTVIVKMLNSLINT